MRARLFAIAALLASACSVLGEDAVDALTADAKPKEVSGNMPGDAPRRDPEKEARLMAAFKDMGTEKARVAIPRLIELLDDARCVAKMGMGDTVRVWHRAEGALVTITWRFYQQTNTISEGCLGTSPWRPGKEEPAWADWWKANKDGTVEDWHRSAVALAATAFEERKTRQQETPERLQWLTALGPATAAFLDDDTKKNLLVAAADPKEPWATRESLFYCVFSLGLEGASDLLEKIAVDPAEKFEPRYGAITVLSQGPESIVPALLRIARTIIDGNPDTFDEAESTVLHNAFNGITRHVAEAPRFDGDVLTKRDVLRERLEKAEAAWKARKGKSD